MNLLVLLQVLFRVNFLVVLLCLTINRPYQFYYIVPLVSVWFLVVYVVLGVWPRVDSKTTESKCWVSGRESTVKPQKVSAGCLATTRQQNHRT